MNTHWKKSTRKTKRPRKNSPWKICEKSEIAEYCKKAEKKKLENSTFLQVRLYGGNSITYFSKLNDNMIKKKKKNIIATINVLLDAYVIKFEFNVSNVNNTVCFHG